MIENYDEIMKNKKKIANYLQQGFEAFVRDRGEEYCIYYGTYALIFPDESNLTSNSFIVRNPELSDEFLFVAYVSLFLKELVTYHFIDEFKINKVESSIDRFTLIINKINIRESELKYPYWTIGEWRLDYK